MLLAFFVIVAVVIWIGFVVMVVRPPAEIERRRDRSRWRGA
jgi:hypothetical protein